MSVDDQVGGDVQSDLSGPSEVGHSFGLEVLEDAPELTVAENLRVVARAATSAANISNYAVEALAVFASRARAAQAEWDAGRSPDAGPLYLALGEAQALLGSVMRDFDTAMVTLTAMQVQVARSSEGD